MQDVKHIKYMYIYKPSTKSCNIDVAIIDDDLNIDIKHYVERAHKFRVEYVKNIKHCVFRGYFLDKTTKIAYHDVIDVKTSPFMQYLRILNTNFDFVFKRTNVDSIVDRICTCHAYFTGKSCPTHKNHKYFLMLWEKLVLSGACPWIDKQIDADIKMMSVAGAYTMQVLYLGAYFVAVKAFYAAKIQRYRTFGTTSILQIKKSKNV